MDGVEAIGLPEGLRGHILLGGLSHAGGDQLHPGGIGDELEGILVAGDDDGLPAGGGVLHRDGAHEVVGLPAVHLIAGDVHGGEHVLQDGQLGGQLIGHPLPLGLVALVGQVTEGGRFPVEADAQGVGRLLPHQLLEDGEETVDGVGGGAVPGGEHPDAVKGPVDDGVAVDDHELHGSSLRAARKFRYSIVYQLSRLRARKSHPRPRGQKCTVITKLPLSSPAGRGYNGHGLFCANIDT